MAARPILILGASSLVGGFLLPRLEAAGLPFTAVSRRVGERGPHEGWLQADLATPEGRAALPPAPIVICLAPAWVLPEALETLKANGLKRLIAFSSTSVVTKAASPLESERKVARDLDRGEAAVRSSGVDWTILRPTLIYAEGQDGNISRLASIIRRFGFIPLSGAASGLRQPVHADDLAFAVLQALASPATHGRDYDLSGSETLSYRAMVERIFRALGKRPRIVTVPPFLWRTAFNLAAPLLPGATGEMGTRMERDLVFVNRKATADFGWKPRGFEPKF